MIKTYFFTRQVMFWECRFGFPSITCIPCPPVNFVFGMTQYVSDCVHKVHRLWVLQLASMATTSLYYIFISTASLRIWTLTSSANDPWSKSKRNTGMVRYLSPLTRRLQFGISFPIFQFDVHVTILISNSAVLIVRKPCEMVFNIERMPNEITT